MEYYSKCLKTEELLYTGISRLYSDDCIVLYEHELSGHLLFIIDCTSPRNVVGAWPVHAGICVQYILPNSIGLGMSIHAA